jgi:K+-transporting ATPase A subunit
LALALAMFVDRYFVVMPVLAITGSLAAKQIVPRSAGHCRPTASCPCCS